MSGLSDSAARCGLMRSAISNALRRDGTLCARSLGTRFDREPPRFPETREAPLGSNAALHADDRPPGRHRAAAWEASLFSSPRIVESSPFPPRSWSRAGRSKAMAGPSRSRRVGSSSLAPEQTTSNWFGSASYPAAVWLQSLLGSISSDCAILEKSAFLSHSYVKSCTGSDARIEKAYPACPQTPTWYKIKSSLSTGGECRLRKPGRIDSKKDEPSEEIRERGRRFVDRVNQYARLYALRKLAAESAKDSAPQC